MPKYAGYKIKPKLKGGGGLPKAKGGGSCGRIKGLMKAQDGVGPSFSNNLVRGIFN